MASKKVEGYKNLSLNELIEEWFFLTELSETVEGEDIHLDIARIEKELGKYKFATKK